MNELWQAQVAFISFFVFVGSGLGLVVLLSWLTGGTGDGR